MTDKETLQREIYTPARELKDRFYAARTMEDWSACKEELKTLLEKIDEPLMTSDFATNYKKSLVDAIAKMWVFKEKQFNKTKYTPQPKQSYIFRPEEGQKIIEFLDTLNKVIKKKYDI